MLRDKIEIIEDIIYNETPNNTFHKYKIINKKEWNINIHKAGQIYNEIYLNSKLLKEIEKRTKKKISNTNLYNLPIIRKDVFIEYLENKGVKDKNKQMDIVSNIVNISEIFGLETEGLYIEGIGNVLGFKRDLNSYWKSLENILKITDNDSLLPQLVYNNIQDFAYNNSTIDSIVELLELSIEMKSTTSQKIREVMWDLHKYKQNSERYMKSKRKMEIFIFILIMIFMLKLFY